MKIEINLKLIFMIILIFLFKNLENYIIFFVFIFLHEMSHFIVGILIGGKPKKILLTPFGISLEFYYYGKNTFINKLFFYLSGPIFNLIMTFAFYFSHVSELNVKAFYINLVLFLFNVLPILPLDGGKILKESLIRTISFRNGNKIALLISKINLSLISFLYGIFIIKIKNIYIVFLIIYLWYLYYLEEKRFKVVQGLYDTKTL